MQRTPLLTVVAIAAIAAAARGDDARASPATQPAAVPRFGVFEAAFDASNEHADPLAAVTADAVLTRPDGRTWRSPLFWDGGRTWRLRVSPDAAGEWPYRIHSNDPALDGKAGSFQCGPASLRGSLQPMAGFPHHFQYQDGTPAFLFGDTHWRLFCSKDEKRLNRQTVRHYLDVRAAQKFNYVHADVLGYVAKPSALNEGGPAFLAQGQRTPNPAYFQEVDARLRYANERGITIGLIFSWGQGDVSWKTFADDDARLRYARYLTARYAAFDVVLIVSGEWQFMKERKDLFLKLGDATRAADPHGRMIAIHPGPGIESNGDLAAAPWMSFGEYLQAYQVGPNKEASDADRDKLRRYVLGFRKNGKPVVNSEYAYFLRDRNLDGKTDKEHSHTRDSFRRASWMMPMAGAYFVTGFGTTYFGGDRDPGPFDVDAAKNDPAEADLGHLKAFFEALEWWRLAPADALVSTDSPGVAYCLAADDARTYVVYASGAAHVKLDIGRREAGAGKLTVRRYDPREGRFEDAPDADAKAPVEFTPPDRQDWVFLVREATATR